MPTYSISYDITENSKTSYDSIEDVITSNCSGYCKYATTTWIVVFNGTADQLSKWIRDTGFSSGDRLLVIEVVNNKQGWLTEKQWDTINSFF